jgi:DNA-directed RNA polymerase specialized sigma24 family protein
MPTPEWYGQVETTIKRMAARWHAITSGRLALDGDDVAQELWVAALAAERQRPGTWRVAVRRDFANLVAKEIRRNRHV